MAEQIIGEIRAFAFGFAPRGWIECNGQVLPISIYTALYSLIGTTYGGNGQTTFAVPNLRGRVMVGRGQLPGGETYYQGQMIGLEEVSLTVEQMPAHRHGWTAATGSATAAPPANNLLAEPNFNGQPIALYANPAEGDAFVRLSPDTITPSGGGRPHGNVQPYLTTGYYIAFTGFFPQRG